MDNVGAITAASPQVLTPERQKGLLIGSLLAAAINASTGNDAREALIKAAVGGMKAYTGGINSVYDIEKANLDIKRQQDLMAAANQTRQWAMEDRPGEVTKNELLLRAAQRKEAQDIEDRPYEVEKRNIAKDIAQQSLTNAKTQGMISQQALEGTDERNKALDIIAKEKGMSPSEAAYVKWLGKAGAPYVLQKLKPAKIPQEKFNPSLWNSVVKNIKDQYLFAGEDIPANIEDIAVGKYFDVLQKLNLKGGQQTQPQQEVGQQGKILTRQEKIDLGVQPSMLDKTIYQFPDGSFDIK